MKRITTLVMIAAMSASGAVSAAQAATTRIEKFFNNWKVECRDDEVNKSCALVYALVNRDNKRTVFSWTIIPDRANPEQNSVVVFTPFNVDLPKGVSVRFANGEPIALVYKTCGSRGCVSEFTLTDSWSKALTSQEKMTVSYTPIRGNGRDVEVDLAGFDDALAFYTSEMQNR